MGDFETTICAVTVTAPAVSGRVTCASADDLPALDVCPTAFPLLQLFATPALAPGSSEPPEAYTTNPLKSAPLDGLARVTVTRSPGASVPEVCVRVYPPSPVEDEVPWPALASQPPGLLEWAWTTAGARRSDRTRNVRLTTEATRAPGGARRHDAARERRRTEGDAEEEDANISREGSLVAPSAARERECCSPLYDVTCLRVVQSAPRKSARARRRSALQTS